MKSVILLCLFVVLVTGRNINLIPAKLETLRDLEMKDYVKFFLYTSANENFYNELFVDNITSLKLSNFEKRNPSAIIIHGYMNNIQSDIIQNTKSAILNEIGNYNVIGVDWSLISTTFLYEDVVKHSVDVGKYVSVFVDFLHKEEQAPLDNFHIIGHSLGAHVAGIAGSNLQSGKIKRITGLDPALPGFENCTLNQRIDASDAEFVDCIHTCGEVLGIFNPICHADFYPNGGKHIQPDCSAFDIYGICSHDASYKYFIKSITPGFFYNSTKCNTIPDKQGTGCLPSYALMGYPATKNYEGIFYVNTTE